MKIKSKLAAALALAMVVNTSISYAAEASNTEKSYIVEISAADINQAPNINEASAAELKAYESALNLYENEAKAGVNVDAQAIEVNLAKLRDDFGKEFNLRSELTKEIYRLEKLVGEEGASLIEESVAVVNGDNLKQIASQTAALKDVINKREAELALGGEVVNLSLATEVESEIAEANRAYLDKGSLILADKLNEVDKAKLARLAFTNSKAYYLASEDEIGSFDKMADRVNAKEVANEADAKLVYDSLEGFTTAEDKGNYLVYQADVSGTNFNASNDTVTDSSDMANANPAAEADTNAGSAFASNPKTSTEYNKLSDPQKRELNAIDTNNDGILQASELDSSANYTSDIKDDSWLYPFTEAGQNAAATTETVDATQANPQAEANQTATSTTETTTTDESTSTESTTTEEREMPQTVTIDNSDETRAPELSAEEDDTADNQEEEETEEIEEAPAAPEVTQENTSAASIVQTGIRGLGIVALILVVAIGAYYFLAKNNKEDKNNRK